MSAPDTDTLDAVITVLKAQGLTLDDLTAHAGGDPERVSGPRVGAYIADTVRPALSKGRRTTWSPYFDLLTNGYAGLCACTCDRCLDHFKGDSSWEPCPCVTTQHCDCSAGNWDNAEPYVTSCLDQFAGYGDRYLAELTVADLEVAGRWATQRAVKRGKVRARNRARDGRPTEHTDGRHALENFCRAASAMYRLAIDDDSIRSVQRNLALSVTTRKRPDVVRRALTAEQTEELWSAVFTSGGTDTELDMLIVWALFELGSRRGGPISMQISDLRLHSDRICLHEKNDKQSEQPASPALIATLLDHALRRNPNLVVATSDGLDPADVSPLDFLEGRARLDSTAPVFYYTPKRRTTDDGLTETVMHPLTSKRFETLFNRLKKALPWLDEMHGRPHDLRRTGATFIERAFGTAVAQQWLRHTVQSAVGVYVAAGDDEVVRAHQWWTGTSDKAS